MLTTKPTTVRDLRMIQHKRFASFFYCSVFYFAIKCSEEAPEHFNRINLKMNRYLWSGGWDIMDHASTQHVKSTAFQAGTRAFIYEFSGFWAVIIWYFCDNCILVFYWTLWGYKFHSLNAYSEYIGHNIRRPAMKSKMTNVCHNCVPHKAVVVKRSNHGMKQCRESRLEIDHPMCQQQRPVGAHHRVQINANAGKWPQANGKKYEHNY